MWAVAINCSATSLFCGKGYRAFQPAELSWVETGQILADEFGDGDMPASTSGVRPRTVIAALKSLGLELFSMH